MEIGCLVVSHKKAEVQDIERVWLESKSKIRELFSNCLISEYAYLFTCNRFELYAVGEKVEDRLRDIAKKLNIEDFAEILMGDDCLKHILKVAAGIESMIVGEEQVLGQVRQYYNLCKNEGMTGEILNKVFSKAVQTGRRVRRETKISKGSVSIGSAAVEVAEKILGSLNGKKVLLVGAGEMGTLVAKALAKKDVKAILIANRTYSKAEELARRIGGIAVRFDKLREYLRVCDVVISATSAPHTVISRKDVEEAMTMRDKKLLIIDIALPRDVEESVSTIEGVELLTIDDLRRVSEENLRKRLAEVEKAERIIEEEFEQLKLLLKDVIANSAIAAMYSLAKKYAKEEIEELYFKLAAKYDLDSDVKDMLEDFANSLIKKFLRGPTVRLREAARSDKNYVIESIKYLFGDGNGRISEVKDEKIEKAKPP